MKNKTNILQKVEDCEHKELFALSGIARYEAIKQLPLKDLSPLCSFYKHCNKCPLFLDGKEDRSYCADLASDSIVEEAIANGAEFITMEDLKNEEFF